MIFIRRVAHFQSTKLLKNPLHVGYPLTGDHKSAHQLLCDVLFEGNVQNVADLKRRFEVDAEILKRFDFAAFQTVDRPQKVSGAALFQQQHAYNTRVQSSLKSAWNSLPQVYKDVYDDETYINESHESSLRIWKGYEIVEFLKRFAANFAENPYPVAGLQPWEIIMDKLRTKSTYFTDYYDWIIREATKQTARNAYQNYYKQLKRDLEPYHLPKANSVLKNLSHRHKMFLQQQAQQHELHVKLLKQPPEAGVMGYSAFLEEFKEHDGAMLRVPEIQIAASTAWRQLPPEKQAEYSKRQQNVHSTHAYQYEKLIWKTRMVLNYIYNVCGTDTAVPFAEVDRDFDRALRGRFYINRNYVRHHIFYRDNSVRVALARS